MPRIPDKEIEQMIKNVEEDFNKYYSDYAKQQVLVEFPLGELMNPKIRGYIWAWEMKGLIKPQSITEQDKFNAQGLEGKVSIPTSLFTALLVYRDLPIYRRQIIKLESKHLT